MINSASKTRSLFFTMNFSVVILGLFLCATGSQTLAAENSNNPSSESDLQSLVTKFLKKVGEILHGNDPYSYEGSSSNSSTYGTRFNGSLTDVIISGISTMNVTFLNVTQDKTNIYLGLNLTFNNLLMTGKYYLDLDTLTMLKLYGAGELGTKASFAAINITASLDQDTTKSNVLQFTDLIINLGIPALKIDVKNLLNRPAVGTFASQILTDISPKLLGESGKVASILSSWAKSKANKAAEQYGVTLAILIEFMQKFTD